MPLDEFTPVDPPLRWDEGGVVRVGNSRISLDLIVERYESGATPEEMCRAYDTLVLADVYAVIAYYLQHRNEVATYLQRRAAQAELQQSVIESDRQRVGRQELLGRRAARDQAHAPAGQ